MVQCMSIYMPYPCIMAGMIVHLSSLSLLYTLC